MRASLVGILLAAACGSPPSPARPVAPGSASAAAPAAPVARPASRLGAALGKLGEGPPLLEALPASSKAELSALLAKLDAAQLGALKSDASLAAARPMLHLVAGGESPAALFAVAASSAGSDDLVLARRSEGNGSLADLVPAVRELSARAARRWLFAQQTSVGDPELTTPELCEQIAHAAETLQRTDLARLAREVAVDLKPSAEHLLALADAAARDLDADAAQRSLARARGSAADAEAAARCDALIAAAKLARGAPASSADGALGIARAQLLLGRDDDAKKTLAPHQTAADRQLGLAAALSLASTDGGVCPGLPPGVGSALLCAAAWRQSNAATEATARLQRAWDSGAGRDDAAIETYLGMVHVAPWTYETLAPGPGDPKQLAARFRERLSALQAAAHAAATGSARFEPLAVFVDTLGAGLEASLSRKPGDRVRIPDATQSDLRARALTLGPRGGEIFVQAAVLGVAALTAQDHDVADLLEPVPDQLAAHLRVARASLRFWSAVAHQRPEVAEKAKAELAELLPSGADHQAERVSLLLLMAEADAALGGDDQRRLDVLARVAGQLTDEGVPVGLRMRAAIDVSGALFRGGKLAEATTLLDGVVATLPQKVAPGADSDLRIVAISQLLVLRGLAAHGAERADYAKKLEQLVQAQALAQLPASIRLWRELWVRELSYLVKADACGGRAPCVAAAARGRSIDAARIDEAIGVESGRITRAGTLPAGTLKLSFSFTSSGLTPLVEMEPRLLAVVFPPRAPGPG